MITAVTLAELSVGPLVAADEQERFARQRRVPEVESSFDPLPFDARAALRRSGRTTSARAFDAMVAATAVANELPVYTCNAQDFEGIDGVRVRPVPHPGPR